MPHPSPTRQARRRRARLLRVLGITTLGIFLAGIISIFAFYQWVKSYVRSEEFRQLVENTASSFLHAEVELSPLTWERLDVRAEKLTATQGASFGKLRAEDMRGTITLGGLTRGIWTLNGARVENLVLDFKKPRPEDDATAPAESFPAPAASAPSTASLPGWMQAKVTIPEIRVRNANIRFGSEDMDFRILGASALVTERESGDHDLDLRGGFMRVAPLPGAGLKKKTFILRDARARISKNAVYVTESALSDEGGTYLSIDGTVPFDKQSKDFKLHTRVEKMPVSEVLGPEWTNRIFGRLNLDFTSQPEDGEMVHEGRASLTDARIVTPETPKKQSTGVTGLVEQGWSTLTSTLLPVLGAYTEKTRQFRNLLCDDASCRFRQQGNRIDLRAISIQSRGLLGVEGELSIVDRQLQGLLQVGVTRQTLSGIPGAETEVFTTERDGLLWTPVRISGTLDNPAEDLTRRLVDAAGVRVLEALPELGLGALTNAVENGAGGVLDTGREIIRGGTGIIEGSTGIIEGGSNIIEGVLPVPLPGILPRPTPRPQPEPEPKPEKEKEKENEPAE